MALALGRLRLDLTLLGRYYRDLGPIFPSAALALPLLEVNLLVSILHMLDNKHMMLHS